MSFSSDSGSLEVTTTEYEVNPEYTIGPPVSVYVESDRLIPSYHDRIVYTDTSPTTYVVESDGSCCLVGLLAGLFCCCSSD